MSRKPTATLGQKVANEIRETWRRAEHEAGPVARMLKDLWPMNPSPSRSWIDHSFDVRYILRPPVDLPPRIKALPEAVQVHWGELESYLSEAPPDPARDLAISNALKLGYGLATMAGEREHLFQLVRGRHKKSASADKRATWLRTWLADPARNWPAESLAVSGSDKTAKARRQEALLAFAKQFGLWSQGAEDPLHRARDKFRRAREALKK